MKLLDKLNPDVCKIASYKPGRPIEEVATELGLNPDGIIKLASNESAFGVSPKAVDALHKSINECFRYPDGGAIKLRKKIAEKYCIDIEQVVVGNGSNEILELVGHCFMNRNTSTVVSCHSFVVYKLTTQLFGARLIEVPMTNMLVHDLYAMLEQIEKDTSVVFICNPNNPTGTMAPNNELYDAVDKIPEDVLVVIDEAYAEVAIAEMPDTRRYLLDKHNVLICRTFSKGYGLAGLRLGYGLGPVPLIDVLQKARQPFNVNLMAQNAGIAALNDDEFIANGRQHYLKSKELIENACLELNLKFIPTTVNFMLIEVGDGAYVMTKLLEKGVIVRSMECYQLPHYIRVTFGTQEENKRFVSALKSVLQNK